MHPLQTCMTRRQMSKVISAYRVPDETLKQTIKSKSLEEGTSACLTILFRIAVVLMCSVVFLPWRSAPLWHRRDLSWRKYLCLHQTQIWDCHQGSSDWCPILQVQTADKHKEKSMRQNALHAHDESCDWKSIKQHRWSMWP